jgi:tetratricopeptide (TPR) repeat protein
MNDIVASMSSLALELLAKRIFSESFTLLLKIRELMKAYPTIIGEAIGLDALNNLSCCYTKFDHHIMALKTLEDALKMIHDRKMDDGTAYTYINLCSVCSGMKRHSKAVEYGQLAIAQLEKEIARLDGNNDMLTFRAMFIEKIRLLAIAYYSIAVECLKLEVFDLCSKYLEKADLCLKNFLVSDFNYQKLENE